MYLKRAFTVMATEAGFVVDFVVCCKLIHQVDGLLTSFALLRRTSKSSHLQRLPALLSLKPKKILEPLFHSGEQEKRGVVGNSA